MSSDPDSRLRDPGLAKTSLIRELVDLSRFTEDILRTLGSGVLAVDGDGLVTFVNPAAEALMGLPAQRLLHRHVDSVVVLRGGGSLIDPALFPEGTGEVDLELSDGRAVTVEVRLSARESGESPTGTVAILTDRTDLKRAEQQARRQERLASLGELSAGVAHEIRNPLAGIGASAQLLRERLQDADHARLADLILNEVERLDRIVENMLQFARPAQPNLRREPLEACVDRGVELIQERAVRFGVRVEVDIHGDIPPLWIDSDQMVQAVLNILQNAVEAAEGRDEARVRVELGLVRRRPYVRRRAGRRAEDRIRPLEGQAPPQDWVELRVSDNGPGVAQDVLERVFDPFYTTRKQGTGLGLSITQAIVHEHGGRISIQSDPGEGTLVLVDLPLDKRRGNRRRG